MNTIEVSTERKALKLLAECDEGGEQVHQEVVCYKKISKLRGTIKETLKLTCHTEAQIKNFYKVRKPRGRK